MLDETPVIAGGTNWAVAVAIRFAPDDEVPDLTRRTLNGELKSQADIKRAIKNWRADTLRA